MSKSKVLSELIQETEQDIIKILVGAYNSGNISKESFSQYEWLNIKNLLFMRSELDSRLYTEIEGHSDEIDE